MKREYIEKEGDLLVKSPITEEFTAIVEHDELNGETMLCKESGYIYMENIKPENMPGPIKAKAVHDSCGKVWHPLTVQTTTWIIFMDDSVWTYAPIVEADIDSNETVRKIDLANRKDFETFKECSEYANSL